MNDWIVVDPAICAGKPVIRGTRIMVKNILGMIAGGYTLDQVLQAYPELTREMIAAALQYAVTVIDEEKVLVHVWDRVAHSAAIGRRCREWSCRV